MGIPDDIQSRMFGWDMYNLPTNQKAFCLIEFAKLVPAVLKKTGGIQWLQSGSERNIQTVSFL